LPLKEGWEVSPDRQYKFEKMLRTDDVGDPILTSKCFHQHNTGLLMVSNKGIAWRKKTGVYDAMSSAPWTSKSSRWVRWHDVARLIPLDPGAILVEVKKRKKGSLLIDK